MNNKILFDSKKFDSIISIFTEEIAKILSQEILKNKNSYNNLELSWCDGLSGLILYLCLVEPLKYSKLISEARVVILNHHLSMEHVIAMALLVCYKLMRMYLEIKIRMI